MATCSMTDDLFCRTQAYGSLWRWALGGIMLFVVIGGYWLPLLGWVVPVVMMTGISVGFLRGRYACGNLCPRGGFYDTWFHQWAGRRSIPPLLRHTQVRWVVVAILMAVMVVRGLEDPTSLRHWGGVFWWMCAVTTALGVILGRVFDARSWCTVCPIGTLSAKAGQGGQKRPLQIVKGCKNCRQCEQVCPMQLPLLSHQNKGEIVQADCVQCGACIDICPPKILQWAKDG